MLIDGNIGMCKPRDLLVVVSVHHPLTRALLLAFLQSVESVVVARTTSVGEVLTFLCRSVVVVLRETSPGVRIGTDGQQKRTIIIIIMCL